MEARGRSGRCARMSRVGGYDDAAREPESMLLNRLIDGFSPSRRTGADDAEAALRGLLADDGVFAGDSAPAALLRADGSVVSGNASFMRVASGLKELGILDRLVSEAASSGTVRREIADLGRSRAAQGVWELVALPLPGGANVLVQAHDLSRDRALREALVDSRQRYKDIVEASSDFVWETGPDGNFVFVSRAGAMGFTPDELVGHHPSEFVPRDLSAGSALPFLAHDRVTDVDVWFRRADGEPALLVASAVPITGNDGGWIGARGVCRDVTRDRERDAALAAAQTRERLLAYVTRAMHDEINPADMLAAAAEATARALSASNCRIYRVSPSGGFVRAAEHGPQPGGDAREESLLARAAETGEPVMAADSERHVMVEATNYHKQVNGAVTVTRDFDRGAWTADDVILAREIALQLAIAIEQIEYHGKLETLSRTDELTGLLNRRAFFEEMEARIERERSNSGAGALFFIDLDNFKLVNDMHGHHRGDEALVAVASILTENTRPGDLVSRFGGDEFALWLDRTDDESAAPRARELLKAAERLREFSGDENRPLSFSVGIATWSPGADETVAGLTGRADAAMYEIKRGSKGGYVLAPPCDPRAALREEVSR